MMNCARPDSVVRIHLPLLLCVNTLACSVTQARAAPELRGSVVGAHALIVDSGPQPNERGQPCGVRVRVGGSEYLLQRAEYSQNETVAGNVRRMSNVRATGTYAPLDAEAGSVVRGRWLVVNCLSGVVLREVTAESP